MRLQLSRCLIRSFCENDVGSIQQYANNRNIWLNLRDTFPHPYGLDDAKAFLGWVAGQSPEVTFAIATPAEAIGCIGLTMGHDVHRKAAELGYWLAEPFWGRGIMSETVAAFSDYAFSAHNDLVRIYAEPFAGNAASARILEKAGFIREGCLRANVCKDGRILDSLMYARVRNG